MKSSSNDMAERFCTAITNTPEMSNATARIGAWLIGAAVRLGGFPIELSYRQVRLGFTKDGVTIGGTGSRSETIRASLEWLEANGYLTSRDGSYINCGHYTRIYDLSL